MSKVFRQIKESLTIRQIVEHFGYNPNRTGFIHSPVNQERTPSCKLYYRTNTFYDFSSNTGGDGIKFAAAVLGVDNWQACQYLVEVFSLSFSVSGSIDNRAEIEQREAEQKRQQQREQEFKAAWRKEVELLKWWEGICKKTLEEKRFPPFSESQASLVAELQKVSYKLDVLCAVNQKDYQRLKPEAQRGFSSDRPQWLLDILLILKEDGLFAATQEELEEIQAQREFERNRKPGVDRKFRITWFKNSEAEQEVKY